MARHGMYGLGKLPAGCEMHSFADGSRRKVCKKRKASAAAKRAWAKNLKSACSKAPAKLKKACAKVK